MKQEKIRENLRRLKRLKKKYLKDFVWSYKERNSAQEEAAQEERKSKRD